MGEEKKPKPMALGEAVSRGIIANETLAYFIGRTWLFFLKCGVDPARMRFRQHLQHEVSGRGAAAQLRSPVKPRWHPPTLTIRPLHILKHAKMCPGSHQVLANGALCN